ncbi:phage virion morphogenesis protein [Salmonella enterica subsp. enterica serovar Kiambu]|uniref:phage virion morphogenesis protein n=1 Tax=Salmonella enterica TaxID=28901 RepID=UPI00111D9408|nr:phage virion morphogenesis protein [Salmonella enterica]EBQ6170811.1 phage virion morphogenesis protein [Salmonella enterica subsp. enterica serovar Derby]EBU7035129.1 phage virion morphogenesis protein [Salmonella enterica subsp. enterica serovar Indiana]ELI7003282.1 phage virion morphogenesis protein [Citrobacter freundii]EAV5169625.1 phage virion morphogenesis protein [Salmonella enterica]EDT7921206.1 phage virion morphogenesis protein [Salmonella enterica subsp. enterica serovar Kiambu]
MNDFKPFDDKLAALIAALSPTARRRMAADIAKTLRTRQQRRIKTQKAPDGTPYAARKRQPVKAKKGRVKREMFAKLRTSRFMKASAGNDAAVVEFTGKVQRMVNVHQYGLKDKPGRNSAPVQYDARPLVGFSDDDRQVVEEIIISKLSV